MNTNNSINNLTERNTLQKTILDNIFKKISDNLNDSEKTSKEKYETKLKMIELAEDMSTQEKLDAMDQNYDRRNQERLQNLIIFAMTSFSLVGFATVTPVAAKTIRKLFTT